MSASAGALSLDGSSSEPLLVQLVRIAMAGDVPQPTGSMPASKEEEAAPVQTSSLVPPVGNPLSISIHSEPAPPLRTSGPPTPTSPLSPLLSVLPAIGGKPKPAGGAFVADLPPLAGRATVPPLAGTSSPPTAVGAADEERRFDALESKLASLAGLAVRPAPASQLAPLPSSRGATASAQASASPPTAVPSSAGQGWR